MDHHYDFRDASNTLEQLAREGCTQNRLSEVTETRDWDQTVDVRAFHEPKMWRLVNKPAIGSALDALDEQVFTIRGILCGKELPPVTEKPHVESSRYRFLRQGISVTGYGTPSFENAVKSALRIYELFQRQFCEGKMEHWGPGNYSGHSSLNLSNRYFTPRRDAPAMVHIPFDQTVDPRGMLEAMAEKGFVHGEENIVRYYIRRVDEKGCETFESQGPQIFRLGDLVEAQISFIVVPLRGDSVKMHTVLHSIVLLNGDFSKIAKDRRVADVDRVKPTALVRRRVGYEEPANKKIRTEPENMEGVEQ